MNLIIRVARPEDSDVLAQIEQDCFSDPSWKAPDFSQYPCLVAELEGRVVGFLVTHTVYSGEPSHPPEEEVLNLAVVPVARRLGIATALLQYAIRPNTRYFLEVRESNTSALNLYKRLGFIESGRRPNYYDNPPETAIVMSLN